MYLGTCFIISDRFFPFDIIRSDNPIVLFNENSFGIVGFLKSISSNKTLEPKLDKFFATCADIVLFPSSWIELEIIIFLHPGFMIEYIMLAVRFS